LRDIKFLEKHAPSWSWTQ